MSSLLLSFLPASLHICNILSFLYLFLQKKAFLPSFIPFFQPLFTYATFLPFFTPSICIPSFVHSDKFFLASFFLIFFPFLPSPLQIFNILSFQYSFRMHSFLPRSNVSSFPSFTFFRPPFNYSIFLLSFVLLK